MKSNEVLNIVVAHFSYQQMNPMIEVISQAAAEKGIPSSGMDLVSGSWQGGTQGTLPVRHYLRLGEKAWGSHIPLGEGDILLGLEAGHAARVASDVMGCHGTAIINTWQYHPPYIPPPYTKYPTVKEVMELLEGLLDRVIPVDAVGLAAEAGDKKVAQGVLEYVMLGALMGTGLLPFSTDDAERVMAQLCRPEQKEQALLAYRLGAEATAVTV